MTKAERDALLKLARAEAERAGKATKEPWFATIIHHDEDGIDPGVEPGVCVLTPLGQFPEMGAAADLDVMADVEFIAMARTAVPALAAGVVALAEENARLRKALECAIREWGDCLPALAAREYAEPRSSLHDQSWLVEDLALLAECRAALGDESGEGT